MCLYVDAYRGCTAKMVFYTKMSLFQKSQKTVVVFLNKSFHCNLSIFTLKQINLLKLFLTIKISL